MKLSLCFLVCMVVLLLALYCGDSDAWGRSRGGSRGRSASRSRSSSRSRVIANKVKSTFKKVINKVKSGAKFVGGAVKGSFEMGKAYVQMRQAKTSGADKYFHAKGNYMAASHGPGGKWAAEKISNARENVQMALGGSAADSAADQKANIHGRNGGDPNDFRPDSLDKKYRR